MYTVVGAFGVNINDIENYLSIQSKREGFGGEIVAFCFTAAVVAQKIRSVRARGTSRRHILIAIQLTYRTV